MDCEDQVSLDSLKSRFVQASSAQLICNVHAVTFQPTNNPSEDRYFVEDWELSNGFWKFAAIFDGNVSYPPPFRSINVCQDTLVAKRWTSYLRRYLA